MKRIIIALETEEDSDGIETHNLSFIDDPRNKVKGHWQKEMPTKEGWYVGRGKEDGEILLSFCTRVFETREKGVYVFYRGDWCTYEKDLKRLGIEIYSTPIDMMEGE